MVRAVGLHPYAKDIYFSFLSENEKKKKTSAVMAVKCSASPSHIKQRFYFGLWLWIYCSFLDLLRTPHNTHDLHNNSLFICVESHFWPDFSSSITVRSFRVNPNDCINLARSFGRFFLQLNIIFRRRRCSACCKLKTYSLFLFFLFIRRFARLHWNIHIFSMGLGIVFIFFLLSFIGPLSIWISFRWFVFMCSRIFLFFILCVDVSVCPTYLNLFNANFTQRISYIPTRRHSERMEKNKRI